MLALGELEIRIEENSARRDVAHKSNVLFGMRGIDRNPCRQAYEGSGNTAGHTFAN